MRISAPLNVKDVLADASLSTDEQRARFIRNRFIETYDSEKRTVLGPVIKTRREMMDQVLSHSNVLDEIVRESSGKRSLENKLRKRAFRYYREIAADFSIVMIKYFSTILEGYIFKKLFSGIHYNLDDLRKIREASQKGPVIFMPCHKSHLDYLILSSLFYQNMLIPPQILSGSNLLFFPMGFIFRKSGAFFMRRSFRGLDLYAAVFKQYVKTLVKEGFGIEFFIEGGRSRTGRISHPQMGFLKYLIDAIEEGYNADMVFVPVAINYDRIVEENSYHKELKGKKKEKENTSAFLKSRRFLNRKHGSVYFSINEPISYRELKDRYPKTDNLTRDIAYHVLKQVNDIIKVTPFSLVTSAMLYSKGKGFSRDYLSDRVSQLYDYLKFMGMQMVEELSTPQGVNEVIAYVLQSYREDSILSELSLDDISRQGGVEGEVLYVLNEEDRPRINFYKNTILHYMLPAAFTAISLLSQSRDGKVTRDRVREGCAFLHRLFSREFIYSDGMEDVDRFSARALEFYAAAGFITIAGDRISFADAGEQALRFFSRAVQDFFESHYIVLSHVMAHTVKSTLRKDLVNEIRKTGIKMYHRGEVSLSESLSLSNYENAISILCDMKVLKEGGNGKKNSDLTLADQKKGEHLLHRITDYIGKMSARPVDRQGQSYLRRDSGKSNEDRDRIH
jgi:glycerol-3-phosphate O-acyltransferase